MPIPAALSIAGSDSSAGAGAQADLKTFTALGVYGLTAVTCVVAEVPGKVSAIAPVPPEVVGEQIRLCLAAFPVMAVKTGMLHSAAVVEAVRAALEPSRPLLVVDPVMVATSGAPLLEPEAVAAYKDLLFPLAALVTPNLPEAAALWGAPVGDLEAMRRAGRDLCARHGCAFLLKGGHLAGEAADLLVTPEGEERVFRAPRIADVSTHGTGCTLSAAIAAGLASGKPLADAVACAKAFVTRAIAGSFRWKNPRGETQALNHQAL
ncbi:MAG: bifunctional hydroxymethylpyrimidine kinase/phosphomethylpyrimidine kinase [Chthoniobacteraceae bacterium]|nr:bifunctional hydroxymethylpyrimidine kinase/phosphomethylpyrimidine kinase [Chthoniobacteraceae bacterium]